MKKLAVLLFGLVFAMGVVGCKDKAEGEKAPACDKICEHVMKIMSEGLSDDEKKEMEGEKAEFMKDCIEDCDKQLDDEAKTCVIAGKTEDDLKKCEKDARKRKKEAKKEGKKEEAK
ncbi:MAG: hypothetical protein ABIK09_15865 [Pseudomonadota bacterium]